MDNKMDIAPLNKWIPNLTHPLIIAGPCSAENGEQVIGTANKLKNISSVRIFRAGIWKPRTRPNCFEGVGDIGLSWMQKVKESTGLLTAVEVANGHHVDMALRYKVDVVWIGARTSANPFSVQEIANSLKGTGTPVMIKNPINADLGLWIGAIERMANAGINKLATIHRGFSNTAETKYRNAPEWRIPLELKRCYPYLPMICDPSHMSGNSKLIQPLCQKAMDMDMDGLMIETHIDPALALSDAGQQITPERLIEILESLEYRTEFSTDKNFELELEALRNQIDRVDHDIIEGLKIRMDIVSKIGNAKLKKNVTALQLTRIERLIQDRERIGKKMGLREGYIRDLYSIIHAESVKMQTDIMSARKDRDSC